MEEIQTVVKEDGKDGHYPEKFVPFKICVLSVPLIQLHVDSLCHSAGPRENLCVG